MIRCDPDVRCLPLNTVSTDGRLMYHDLALGSAMRFPIAPPASRKEPKLAASPIQMVDTSHLIYYMVSYMANPAVIEPPGC